MSTVRSDDGLGELYDSLYHNVIENEVVEQVKKTWLALETSLAYVSLLSNNKAIEVTVGFFHSIYDMSHSWHTPTNYPV